MYCIKTRSRSRTAIATHTEQNDTQNYLYIFYFSDLSQRDIVMTFYNCINVFIINILFESVPSTF